MKQYKLKEHVTDEMLLKLDFSKNRFNDFTRPTKSNNGIIVIDRFTKTIDESRYDRTTYTGFKYSNEYKHQVKTNIQDLIELGYVELI